MVAQWQEVGGGAAENWGPSLQGTQGTRGDWLERAAGRHREGQRLHSHPRPVSRAAASGTGDRGHGLGS